MAAVHFTTIPYEPNTASRHIKSLISGKIRPCTNTIVYARFGLKFLELFRCVFMSAFRIFVRLEL